MWLWRVDDCEAVHCDAEHCLLSRIPGVSTGPIAALSGFALDSSYKALSKMQRGLNDMTKVVLRSLLGPVACSFRTSSMRPQSEQHAPHGFVCVHKVMQGELRDLWKDKELPYQMYEIVWWRMLTCGSCGCDGAEVWPACRKRHEMLNDSLPGSSVAEAESVCD
ncbi:hypothetical protein BAUCODRAFT_35485 [Baudoinia panamericana UAMH 10762]|uniref:Uncharacterized protein n=1 Tax=Baudoinia panamericana (strain UAMH 10762) TaxID=717646 RepID=M2MFX0_BAUPA|nr:uncharacterized protein BAUCODRAFT_35485 [Baudoinia panamericana UAMH 10762]EMC95511.1 hypothetical protein BAUCODRAFT_35485 [Baudoinia panamericana UAMH 10762]